MSSLSFLPSLGNVSLDKGAAARTIGTTDEERTEKDREMGERARARRGVLTSELHFYRLRHERRMEERKKEGRREGRRWHSKPSLRCLF